MNVYKKKSDLKIELSSITARSKRHENIISEKELCNVSKQITDKEFGGYVVLEVKGDSMEKLIMDGAKIVVDPSQRDIVSGEIYALNIPWEGFIVRECRTEPEGLVLRPYNRNYPEVVISWDDFDPGTVIGKVFCSVINVFR